MTAQVEADFKTRLQNWLPKLVLSPSLALIFVFVYGFIIYTVYVSFTDSRILPVVNAQGGPSYDLIGLENYAKLFRLSHCEIAITNLAVFASLYIIICCAIGLMLAIFLDQKIRGEGVLRPIYLYPMALSFIVTGTAWKWFLDPGIGLENTMQMRGWTSFEFDWIKDGDFAIYTLVLAAVWQSSGFVMAMFLAGLTELPATFMYSYTFTRNQMGIGAASAVIMLMTVAAIIVPYLYAELREKK